MTVSTHVQVTCYKTNTNDIVIGKFVFYDANGAILSETTLKYKRARHSFFTDLSYGATNPRFRCDVACRHREVACLRVELGAPF